MATDQLTLNVTCPECGALLPMPANGRNTGHATADVTFDTSAVRAHIAEHQPKPETTPPAPGEQIISGPDLWPGIRDDRQRFNELLTWLRANGIDPHDIPVEGTVSIEPANDGGHLIRHTVYLRNGDGRHYTEPGQDHAAREERTVPLAVPLPDGWPQPVAPVAPDAPLDAAP